MVFLKSCLPLLKLRRLLEQQFVVLQGTSPCKAILEWQEATRPCLVLPESAPLGLVHSHNFNISSSPLTTHFFLSSVSFTCSRSYLNLRILCYVTFNRVIFLYVLKEERGSLQEFSVWFNFNLWNWLQFDQQSCLLFINTLYYNTTKGITFYFKTKPISLHN